ncbi:hypothetical protein AaE_011499, partial [Aphanomyces astaci]
MRTAVEKLEGRPLSDSHLASALLAALPECIVPDLFVWRGAQPSIPYKNMRQLLEQHWPGLVTKYPHYLGPAPIAAAVPVHGSATATATTRSSALALPAFRDGTSQREGYGQAATVPWGTQGQDPMADWCGYCLSSGSHSTYTCTKLSRAFHQNAVRQDFVFPPGWAAIPPGELPQSGGGRRTQGGPSGHRGGKRHGKGGGRGGGTGTSFLNTVRQGYASSGQHGYASSGQQGYASSGPPGYAPSGHSGYASMGQGGHSGYASLDYGAYRDDQRGRSPFRQSASRYRSRSGDRYRDYREDRGYYRDDRGYYRDDRGYYRDDRAPYRDDRGSYRDDRGSHRDGSGANQDDRRHRSRSHSMYADRRHRSRSRSAPPVDQGYAHQASTPQRSQSRSASRGSTRTLVSQNTRQQRDQTPYFCLHAHMPAFMPRHILDDQHSHVSFTGLKQSTDKSSTSKVLSTLLQDFSPYYNSLDTTVSRSLVFTGTGWALRVSPTSPVVKEQSRSRHWTVDSGASKHSTFHREWFITYEPFSSFAGAADGHQLHVIGRGTVRLEVAGINDDTLVIYLQDVYHIPDLHFNLFSVGRALHMDRHKIVSITPQEWTLATYDGEFTATYDESTGLYVIATRLSPRIADPTSTV